MYSKLGLNLCKQQLRPSCWLGEKKLSGQDILSDQATGRRPRSATFSITRRYHLVKQLKPPWPAAITATNTLKVQFLSNKPAEMQHILLEATTQVDRTVLASTREHTSKAPPMPWKWRRFMRFSGTIAAGRLKLQQQLQRQKDVKQAREYTGWAYVSTHSGGASLRARENTVQLSCLQTDRRPADDKCWVLIAGKGLTITWHSVRTRCKTAILVYAVACTSLESPLCLFSTRFAASCLVLERAHLLVADSVQVIECHYLHEPRLKISYNIKHVWFYPNVETRKRLT